MCTTAKNVIVISYEEMSNSVENETLVEFYFPLSKLSVNDKFITLPITDILCDTNCIELELVGNDKKSLDDVFNKSEFKLEIGGYLVKYSKIHNRCIIDNQILPLSRINHQDVNIYIRNNLSSEIIKDAMTIKIKMNRLRFTESFYEKIYSNETLIMIPFWFSSLTFIHGYAFPYHVFDYKKEFDDLNSKVYDEVKGEIIPHSQYKWIKLDDCEYLNYDCNTLIKKLLTGYDISSQYVTNIQLLSHYYTKKEKTYVITHTFAKNCDLVSKISINFPRPIDKIENILIKMSHISNLISEFIGFIDLDLRNKCQFSDNNKCLNITLDDNHFIGLISVNNFKLIIEIPNEYDIINIIDNTTLSYEFILCDNPIRKKIALTGGNTCEIVMHDA